MTDNILFSTDPGGDLKKFLQEKNYSKIAVLTDEHTALYCYPVIRDFLPAHSRQLVHLLAEIGRIGIECDQFADEGVDPFLELALLLILERNEAGRLFGGHGL